MADHLDSKSLVPFKRRRNGYHLPGLVKEEEDQMVDQVDPELRPEEQGYVRHYLSYADTLLKNSESDIASADDVAASEPSAQQEREKAQEVQPGDRQAKDAA